MKLREEFKPMMYCYVGSGMLTNDYNQNVVDEYAKKCEKICDNFTIGFAEWIEDKKYKYYSNGWSIPFHKNLYTTEELLTIYKETL